MDSKASRDSPNDRAAILRGRIKANDLAAAEIRLLPLAFPVVILFLVLSMVFCTHDPSEKFLFEAPTILLVKRAFSPDRWGPGRPRNVRNARNGHGSSIPASRLECWNRRLEVRFARKSRR